MPDQEALPPHLTLTPATLMRRFGAAVLDMLILGLFGMGLGLVFADSFAYVGRWGFLIGLVVSGTYFSVMNSKFGSGQTLGKRILKIQVLDNAGKEVGISRTLPRFLVFYVPYFLNGQALPAGIMLNPVGAGVLSVLVFGLLLANFYLLVFNRPLRLGLHDISTSTRVVSVPHQTQTATKSWKGHIPIVASLMVGALALPTLMTHLVGGMADSGQLDDLAHLHLELEKLNEIKFARIQDTTTSFNDGASTKSLHAILVVKQDHISNAKAKEACETVLREYPQVLERDSLNISFMHGFDIGIANYWNSQNALSIKVDRANPDNFCTPQSRIGCEEQQIARGTTSGQSCTKS